MKDPEPRDVEAAKRIVGLLPSSVLHPEEYGLLRDIVVTDPERLKSIPTSNRFRRCPICEQWSPCDVRRVALAFLGYVEEADRAPDHRD